MKSTFQLYNDDNLPMVDILYNYTSQLDWYSLSLVNKMCYYAFKRTYDAIRIPESHVNNKDDIFSLKKFMIREMDMKHDITMYISTDYVNPYHDSTVRLMVELCAQKVHKNNTEINLFLMKACVWGSVSILKTAIAHGAKDFSSALELAINWNERNNGGSFPHDRYIHIIKLLINKYAAKCHGSNYWNNKDLDLHFYEVYMTRDKMPAYMELQMNKLRLVNIDELTKDKLPCQTFIAKRCVVGNRYGQIHPTVQESLKSYYEGILSDGLTTIYRVHYSLDDNGDRYYLLIRGKFYFNDHGHSQYTIQADKLYRVSPTDVTEVLIKKEYSSAFYDKNNLYVTQP